MANRIQLGGEYVRVIPDLEQGNALRVNLQNSIDASTGALETVDYAHHEIHSGSMFTASTTVTLGNGGVRDTLITVPDTTKWPHMIVTASSTGETSMILYEGPATSGGTAMVAYNRNRNYSSTATVTLFTGPTVSNAGTAIETMRFGSGQQGGGEARESHEWVLRQNMSYLLRITSAAADNDVNYNLTWYEHTNRE